MYINVMYMSIIWMKFYLYTRNTIDQGHKNFFYLQNLKENNNIERCSRIYIK